MQKTAFILTLAYSILVLGCRKETEEIPQQIAGNRIVSIYIEGDTRWFGTERGLSAFDRRTWRNYGMEVGIPDKSINDICSRDVTYPSQLLAATDKGVGLLNKVHSSIGTVSVLQSANSGLVGDIVTALNQDVRDYTWYGTDQGISVESHGRWLECKDNSVFQNYLISDIESGPDSLSFVGLYGKGIALLKPDTNIDAVTTVTYYEPPWSPLPSANVQAIYIDGYKNQWYGTDDGLAFHGGLDSKTDWILYSEEDGLINNNVLSICGDTARVIWIGTVAGVSRYDGERWTNYTIADGLAADSVFSIALDINGSVWFGTNNGTSNFDGSTWITYRRF